MTLVILVADGARPDTLFGAMDAGSLPALAALRARGMACTITSVFPSVTGSAYTPFLMGLHPGRAGLPGLRWYDRDRHATLWPANARSYVGLGGMRADADLTRDFQTLFEHEPHSIGGFTYVGRGLTTRRRIGTGWAFGASMAWTHFRGDLDGWMRFDRSLGEEFVRRIVAQRPRVAFLAHPGIDKLSHQFGQGSPRVLDAMRTVDHTVQLLEDTFARAGRSHELEIWIVSDHGHADVPQHEDLAGTIRSWGHSVRAHPWVIGGRDVAVMVSGNAMAHLYLELGRTRRAVWPALRDRWQPFLDALLQLPAIDLAILPMGESRVRIHSRTRGSADVFAAGDGSYSYRRDTGDPLDLEKTSSASTPPPPGSARARASILTHWCRSVRSPPHRAPATSSSRRHRAGTCARAGSRWCTCPGTARCIASRCSYRSLVRDRCQARCAAASMCFPRHWPL